MQNKFLIVFSVLVLFAGATAIAQRTLLPSGVLELERFREVGEKDRARVVGEVVDSRKTRVQFAQLQLRDLNDGKVLQVTTSNENGEFEFSVTTAGTYVVEMVLTGGAIIAISEVREWTLNETRWTVVQLPGRWDYVNRRLVADQNILSFLGISGELTMTARTLEMALEQNVRPQDPGEPVSP